MTWAAFYHMPQKIMNSSNLPLIWGTQSQSCCSASPATEASHCSGNHRWQSLTGADAVDLSCALHQCNTLQWRFGCYYSYCKKRVFDISNWALTFTRKKSLLHTAEGLLTPRDPWRWWLRSPYLWFINCRIPLNTCFFWIDLLCNCSVVVLFFFLLFKMKIKIWS